jgi:succinate-semialdehyde dehydrogenase/glutarate-semialdehyde dehydrogenase
MGEDALREMCDQRHIGVDRVRMARDPFWYPYTEQGYTWFRKGMRAMFGGGGLLKRVGGLF